MFNSSPISEQPNEDAIKSLVNPNLVNQPTNEAIKQVFEETALTIGSDFFTTLARNLSHTLGIPYVVLTRLGDDEKLHPLAFWNENQFSKLDCYDSTTAPCGITLKEGSYFCSRNIQQLFPKDGDLVTLQAQGYFGVALKNSREEVLGNLYVMDRRPMTDPTLYKGVLTLFAMRSD